MRGRKTGGRVKGTPNKSTASVKEAVELTFQGIGGVGALTAWAKKHPDEFYTKLWGRMLPVDVRAQVEHTVTRLSYAQERAREAAGETAGLAPSSPVH